MTNLTIRTLLVLPPAIIAAWWLTIVRGYDLRSFELGAGWGVMLVSMSSWIGSFQRSRDLRKLREEAVVIDARVRFR